LILSNNKIYLAVQVLKIINVKILFFLFCNLARSSVNWYLSTLTDTYVHSLQRFRYIMIKQIIRSQGYIYLYDQVSLIVERSNIVLMSLILETLITLYFYLTRNYKCWQKRGVSCVNGTLPEIVTCCRWSTVGMKTSYFSNFCCKIYIKDKDRSKSRTTTSRRRCC